VREWLATRDGPRPPEIDQHLIGCPACRAYAARSAEVDVLARPALLVAPPLELQMRLAALAQSQPVYVPISTESPLLGVVAWAIASVLGALAAGQVFGWLQAYPIVVGDVAAALQIVLTSPAVRYLAELQIDLPGLVLWSALGLVAWLFSPSGPLRDVSERLGLPA
jgi:predicted anti-sigma-YlaC factor YlaD